MNHKTYDFTETLQELDAGVFLQKVSKAVRDTAMATVSNPDGKKKGKVMIELTMARLGDSNQISMNHTVKLMKPTRRGKAAEEDTTETVLHVGREGAISIMPYNQNDMFKIPERID